MANCPKRVFQCCALYNQHRTYRLCDFLTLMVAEISRGQNSPYRFASWLMTMPTIIGGENPVMNWDDGKVIYRRCTAHAARLPYL